MKRILTSLSLVFVLVTNAIAGDTLTDDQAKRFVESLETVNGFGADLEAAGKTERLAIDTQPKAGEKFMPYTKALTALKANYPADHAKFSKMIKPHGFNAEEWSGVGDRVMVAYLALRMQEDDPQAMAALKEMDRSMLDMMPPEMKTQMEAAMVMIDAVQSAPAEDIKAVRSVKPELDAYMEAQEKS
ncbi:hypothetical protein [Hyphococcus lacteus]|uniref:DUF2059 domain-containing protein n=1 Tax=Hyphococcus lacteus TaxID=3143536 RepID=A0ABV3Z1F9_9PROT